MLTTDNVSSPPPFGDSDKAKGYITKLTQLISEDKLEVFHTNLKKFDLSSMQDHYRIDLGEYEVEVSHTKQAASGKDFYVMIFNNLKKVADSSCQKVILAYVHLAEPQFQTFKDISLEQIERKREKAEAKRFQEAMMPIDTILTSLDNQISQKDDSNRVETRSGQVILSAESDSALAIPPASS